MYSRTAMLMHLQEDVPSCGNFITSDLTISAARSVSLSNSLCKKFIDDIDQKATDDKALEKFLECNAVCKTFRLVPERYGDDYIIGEVVSLLHNIFGNGRGDTLGMWSFSDYLGVGPGASIESKSDNFYTKLFDSNLSHTEPHLLRIYRSIISANPRWESAERQRFLSHGCKVVEGSKLSFVPKTSDISRTICTEPVLNMLFQKALGKVLERKLLRSFNIDLSLQPNRNRELARVGSIDGSFATIDLSSASDSISWKLLESIFPQHVLKWFRLSRSPVTILPNGDRVNLGMVSSMGNGFTFPLQTLLFASIVASCYRLKGLTPFDGRSGPRNFSVFGDDIIVLRDCYETVVHALELFGFTVNKEKSFNSGNFRESCGGDFFHGHNIRGVYITSLKTDADIYSAVNRLVRWSAQSGVYLKSLIRYLRGKVSFLPIPYCDGDAEGIKVPLCSVIQLLSRDPATQSYKYKILFRKPLEVTLPQPDNEWHDVGHGFGYHQKRIVRTRWEISKTPFGYNPDGLMISFIGGFIRSGKISFSCKDDIKPRYLWRVNSSWDFIPRTDRLAVCGSWEAAALEILSL